MNVASIRDAVGAALIAARDLERAEADPGLIADLNIYPYLDTTPELPFAVVTNPVEVDYHVAMRSKKLTLNLTVGVGRAAGEEQAGRDLDALLSWPGIARALETFTPPAGVYAELVVDVADNVRYLTVGQSTSAIAADLTLTVTT